MDNSFVDLGILEAADKELYTLFVAVEVEVHSLGYHHDFYKREGKFTKSYRPVVLRTHVVAYDTSRTYDHAIDHNHSTTERYIFVLIDDGNNYVRTSGRSINREHKSQSQSAEYRTQEQCHKGLIVCEQRPYVGYEIADKWRDVVEYLCLLHGVCEEGLTKGEYKQNHPDPDKGIKCEAPP